MVGGAGLTRNRNAGAEPRGEKKVDGQGLAGGARLRGVRN